MEETVEHIYPQTPDVNDWIEFDKYKGASENNILLNNLGNLLLLSQSKNSFLQNKPFDEKKKGTNAKSGYLDGSYSETKLARKSEWTDKEILERGIEMLEFMEKRWGVKFEDKKSLLCLDFL